MTTQLNQLSYIGTNLKMGLSNLNYEIQILEFKPCNVNDWKGAGRERLSFSEQLVCIVVQL